MRLMFETFRNCSQPCGLGSHLVVLLLLAMAVVEGHREGKMRTSGSNVELENQVPCSLQEKSKNVNLLDSALESKKYAMRQGRDKADVFEQAAICRMECSEGVGDAGNN